MSTLHTGVCIPSSGLHGWIGAHHAAALVFAGIEAPLP
jgi:hypothetical protein